MCSGGSAHVGLPSEGLDLNLHQLLQAFLRSAKADGRCLPLPPQIPQQNTSHQKENRMKQIKTKPQAQLNEFFIILQPHTYTENTHFSFSYVEGTAY